MPSIAQTLLDKYNGVVDTVQSSITDAADKGIAALHKATKPAKEVRAPLSEEQVRAKEMIRNALRKGVWVIHYTKVDGTASTMEATLDSSLMPTQTIFAGAEKKAPLAEHLLAVYATDRQGWRSFVVSNVTKMEPKL